MEKKENRLVAYLKNSKSELKKVAWPTKKELINHTVLVIGFCLALAVFLGVTDFLLTMAVERVIVK